MSAAVRHDPGQPVPPAPPGLAAALEALPLGRDVRAFRHQVLAARSRLGETMRRVERAPPSDAACAELWAWATWLTVNLGYRADTTVAGYVRVAWRYLAWAATEGVEYAAVTLDQLDAWQRWLALQLRHGPSWRGQQIMAVRSFYNWRHIRGLGPHCAASLRGPRFKVGSPRKYQPSQVRSMILAARDSRDELTRMRNELLVLFLYTTGARREEVATLEVRDLELRQRTGVVKIHGKGAKEREVPIEGPLVAALSEWLLRRDQIPGLATDCVFLALHTGRLGEPMSLRTLDRTIATLARAAKLRDWGVHRFRVTYATALYDQGIDIEEIRRLMGHESIETTRRYLVVSERMRKARLSADHQHAVLGTRPTGAPLWTRLAKGELQRVDD